MPAVHVNTNRRYGRGSITYDEEHALEEPLRLCAERGRRQPALVFPVGSAHHYSCEARRRGEQRSKNKIPKDLQHVYADVLRKAQELRNQGMTLQETCDALSRLGYRTRTGKVWRHPQQICKLLRSFAAEG